MWSNQGKETSGNYGDQGGGYLNSPGQFGSSEGGGERKPRQQQAQNIVPCTVSQILATEQSGDKFVVDNIELHQVTIVGVIRSVNESATRIEYKVDDMTGPPLDVRQFVDNDESTPDEARIVAFRENTYVRAFGHVRAFQDKHHVVAFKIMPVTDLNELTTHMLEVVHAHLALTRGSAGGSGTAAAVGYGGMAGGNVSMAGGYQGARPDQGLTPIQAQVHDVIQACPEDQGISLTHIIQNARGLPQNAIRDAVEFLSTEGHIYSTIDDEHFKATESG